VRLDESRMLVHAGDVVTAGAALAHFDLALWLVRQQSPSLAGVVARFLMLDERASQAPYVIPDHLAHADPLIERFEHWARGRLAQGFCLADAARCIGTSERTLARRMHRVLGKTPLSYFQDLRVQHAVHRLQTGIASVDTIAGEVGYADGVTLRALLRRRLGRGVRELRHRRAHGAGTD
jgi:transcriptional regulator GlxA family with amidase domain